MILVVSIVVTELRLMSTCYCMKYWWFQFSTGISYVPSNRTLLRIHDYRHYILCHTLCHTITSPETSQLDLSCRPRFPAVEKRLHSHIDDTFNELVSHVNQAAVFPHLITWFFFHFYLNIYVELPNRNRWFDERDNIAPPKSAETPLWDISPQIDH